MAAALLPLAGAVTHAASLKQGSQSTVAPLIRSCGQACDNGAVGTQVNYRLNPGYYTFTDVFSGTVPGTGTYNFHWQNSVTEGTSSSRFQYTYLRSGTYSGAGQAEWGWLWAFNDTGTQYDVHKSYACHSISTYENPPTNWTINSGVNYSNPASIDQFVWVNINCGGSLNGVHGESFQNLYNIYPN